MARGQKHYDPLYSLNVRKIGLSQYISREKGDHYYIQTRHNDLFSHVILF